MALRFVILEHNVNGAVHFDLMLEVPGQEKLRTLQLQARLLKTGDTCACKELEAHRRAYLEYEGNISGGRGTVKRIERGTYEALGASVLLSPDDGVCYRMELAKSNAHRW
ncbi:hypothetical protein PLCT1_02748 [Planctomycetaceae bacterium]|nr:hypothetical protein PLCT1_02748 [Planctomycetaceae bacterium]